MIHNVVPPYKINLAKGNVWTGFKSMVGLGMNHIAEGIDHLLFILTLLLVAPLTTNNKKWNGFGGFKYTIFRLLKIITAFTTGHSLTLFAGTVGWLKFPSQPIEILIAVSILVSAIHAIKPIFPGKEIYIASGFGLIHGLAFANTLTSLKLSGSYLALTILGFNIGVELMQLVVISFVIPWLIILSRHKEYFSIRIPGAAISAIAATGWIFERLLLKPNFISLSISEVLPYTKFIIIALAVTALTTIVHNKKKTAS